MHPNKRSDVKFRCFFPISERNVIMSWFIYHTIQLFNAKLKDMKHEWNSNLSLVDNFIHNVQNGRDQFNCHFICIKFMVCLSSDDILIDVCFGLLETFNQTGAIHLNSFHFDVSFYFRVSTCWKKTLRFFIFLIKIIIRIIICFVQLFWICL